MKLSSGNALQTAGTANAPVKRIVFAKKGQLLDATVAGFHDGCLTVELETSEMAILGFGLLLGATPEDRTESLTRLKRESKIKVRVLDVYPGRDLKPVVLVRQVRPDGTFARPPRIRHPRRKPDRFGIRVWHAETAFVKR